MVFWPFHSFSKKCPKICLKINFMANKYRFMSGIVFLEIIFHQDWWEKEKNWKVFNPKASQWFWNERYIAFHKLVGFDGGGGFKNIRPVLDISCFFCQNVTLDDHFETGGPLTVDILHRQLWVCFAQWRSHLEVFVAKQVFAFWKTLFLSV